MAIIEMRAVTKGYDGNVLFENFSQQIEEGEFVAITGESGCGKSTMLNIIGLLESHDSGTVIVSGRSNIPPKSRDAQKLLRVKISYLFQDSGLVEDESVLYNIRLGLRYTKTKINRQLEIVADALERVGLPGLENRRIYQLSGGERQRVAIARVLVKPSSIVLADEPTGSLDSKNRDMVLDMLRMLNRMGKTIIIATHDRYVADQCKREICLNRGVFNVSHGPFAP
ncbi:MAG: ATP-binding cassette domain-containing protein [Peptococcaceae bacterium]|nr:ATP-binding cassette domain-containing protein [Peptococcaceae bacterium]